jgi:hypothetical protein
MCLPAEQALLLTSLIAGALRHERMDMYQGMSTNMGNMIMYLHSTISPTATISGFSAGTVTEHRRGSDGRSVCRAFHARHCSAPSQRWLVAIMRSVMEEHWYVRFVLPTQLFVQLFCAHLGCTV